MIGQLTFSTKRNAFKFGLASFLIIGIGLLLVYNIAPPKQDMIATGFLLDLVVTIPVIYYLLIIRPLKRRLINLLLIFSICSGLAYLILPQHQRQYILELRKLTVLVELGLVVYAVIKLRKIKAFYKEIQRQMPDPAYNLRQSMLAVLGNIIPIRVLSSEIIILKYGLFFWKKRQEFEPSAKTFTTYKDSSYPAIWGVLSFIIVIETFAMHLALNQWSTTAAWIMTFLSIYSLLFFIADFIAVIKRPVTIYKEQLILRTGIRWRIVTKKENILSVERVKNDIEADAFKGAVLKSSSNLLLKFQQPVTIERLYRASIETDQVLLSLDNPEQFIDELKNREG